MSAPQSKKITNFLKPLETSEDKGNDGTLSNKKESDKSSSKRKLDENDPDIASHLNKNITQVLNPLYCHKYNIEQNART